MALAFGAITHAEIPPETLEFIRGLSPEASRFFPLEKAVTSEAARVVGEACGDPPPPGLLLHGYAAMTRFPHELILVLERRVGSSEARIWVAIDRKAWGLRGVTVREPPELWERSAAFLAEFPGMRLSGESRLPLAVLRARLPRRLEPGSAIGFLQKEFEFMSRMGEPAARVEQVLEQRGNDLEEAVRELQNAASAYARWIQEVQAPQMKSEDIQFLQANGPKLLPPLEELAQAAEAKDWDTAQAAYERVGQACDSCHASYLPKMSQMRKAEGGPFPGHFVVGHDLRADAKLGQDAQELATAVKAALLLGRELWPPHPINVEAGTEMAEPSVQE